MSTALDSIDLQLLALLQEDAARSNLALAEAVGVSPATALRRVKRLQDSGVIERTVAVLCADQIGPSLTAIVEVTLDHQSQERLGAFENRAVAEGAVQQCYRTQGMPDFVLIVQVPDMPAYQALAQRLFNSDANVRNVRTFFSVHRAKAHLGVALPGG
jgi:Lrp/AsnC family transcriptional regulator, leucine-responsive regulatory protein